MKEREESFVCGKEAERKCISLSDTSHSAVKDFFFALIDSTLDLRLEVFYCTYSVSVS